MSHKIQFLVVAWGWKIVGRMNGLNLVSHFGVNKKLVTDKVIYMIMISKGHLRNTTFYPCLKKKGEKKLKSGRK